MTERFCIIFCNEPTPYDPPRRLWAFLSRLRAMDQEDIGVQAARRRALRYLREKTPAHEPARAVRRT